MTQGRWFFEKWGKAYSPAPSGAELFAWFSPSSSQNTTFNWKSFTNGLSGVICASLNFLDTSSSSHGRGPVSDSILFGNNFRYGTLSNEIVCTENLTPFKSLLPTRGKSGLATLLNPLKLYSNYHSMGIHFRTYHSEDGFVKYEFVQTVSILLEPFFGTDTKNFKDFSIQSLFGKQLQQCHLCDSSTIHLDLEHSFKNEKISVSNYPHSADIKITTSNLSTIYSYPLQQHSSLSNLNFHFEKVIPIQQIQTVNALKITVNKYQTGQGQLQGTLITTFENQDDKDYVIKYYDATPWYFRLFFHTLEFKLNQQILKEEEFSYVRVSPSKERESPSVIEFSMILRANSTLTLSVAFEKVFLKFTEHPPDANRGFDISSAIVSFVPLELVKSNFSTFDWEPIRVQEDSFARNKIYTESLLVALPVPDFSMPYNVITLSSTIIALFFGNVVNSLIRRFKNKEKQD